MSDESAEVPQGIDLSPATKPQKAARKGVPFQRGHDARRNVTKPGSGRPTNEFRESLRVLVSKPKVKKAVEKILSDPDHRQFSKVYATVVSQAHGNPVQPIEIDTDALPAFKVECE